MIAIVQQDHISAAYPCANFLRNVIRRRCLPVVARDTPHDRLKPQLPHDAEDSWTARAPWRTKKIGMLANSARDGFTTLLKLLANRGERFEREKGMCERVIADHVAAFPHFQGNIRPSPNVTSDHKERRMNVVLRQNVEQMHGVRVVWPVVEGQRNLLAPAPQAVERSAKPLSRRRHGLIPSDDRSSGGEGGKEHGGI